MLRFGLVPVFSVVGLTNGLDVVFVRIFVARHDDFDKYHIRRLVMRVCGNFKCSREWMQNMGRGRVVRGGDRHKALLGNREKEQLPARYCRLG